MLSDSDESFIRSGAPLASDLVLSNIALEYSHVLSAGCGEPFEEHLETTVKKYHGEYILAGEEFTLNARGESVISYADYAIAMVDEIEKGGHIRERISVVGA